MSRTSDGIWQKLEAARAHITEFESLAESIRNGYCSIVFEEDLDERRAALRVRIKPRLPEKLTFLASEAVKTLHFILDRIVRGTVQANTPFTVGISNKFPVQATVEGYERDIRLKCLIGVPNQAIAIIESLQPYHAGNEALLTLAELHDANKHRPLQVVAAISSYSELFLGQRTRPVGEEYFRDGSVYAGPITQELEERLSGMRPWLREQQFEGKCAVAVMLENPAHPNVEHEDDFKLAAPLLWRMYLFMQQRVVMNLIDFVE